ncbi:MAG: LysR family transcriptional regulator [Rhodobacteraceae bacterium]|nr:LysR family transcriptional regulator [Paracoccaceae bacterium]
MDWRSMPPLPALRAFAAFAEEGSVVRAGAALNVSHAAVSQQLRALERHMGLALLDRSGRALGLTAEGTQLAEAVRLGFGSIGNAVRDLTDADADRPLFVSTTPTFAASWLMPRLARFRDRAPDVELRIDPSPALVAFEPGGVDVALRYGSGGWPGLHSEMLLQSPMIIVAAPALLRGRDIRAPEDLADLPWLEELGTTEASNWLRAQGVARGLKRGLTQVPGNLLLDGVRDGQGVAVAVRHFVQRDIAAGRLVELFGEDTALGYHITTREGVLRPAARLFVAWLRRERRIDAGKDAQAMRLS